jgi:hypothetical protein
MQLSLAAGMNLKMDRSWSCTSIAASSFTTQHHSYISGSEIIVTDTSGSRRGRAYYTWANTGGFKIQFDMYQGGGSGADGMCMKYGGTDLGENGEDIASIGFSVCFDSWSNGNDHGVVMGWNGATIFSQIGTGHWSVNVPPFRRFYLARRHCGGHAERQRCECDIEL